MDTPCWHVLPKFQGSSSLGGALGKGRYLSEPCPPPSPLVTPAWLRWKPAADSRKGASLSRPLVGTAGSPRC